MVRTGRWCSQTAELSTASRWDWVNQAWLYLVAELMPDGRWDWTTWSSDSSEPSLHGVTDARADAMAQAEGAAATIGRVRVLGAGYGDALQTLTFQDANEPHHHVIKV